MAVVNLFRSERTVDHPWGTLVPLPDGHREFTRLAAARCFANEMRSLGMVAIVVYR